MIVFTGIVAPAFGQGSLDPAKLLQPPTDTWPTYSGDYTGRRFSPLTNINSGNVKNMSLAWVYRLPQGLQAGTLKATPLEVNGILYFTIPDHVWAIDARSGREIWHHVHPSTGGIHLGNRGVGIYGNWLYFETPDCNLVSLNLKDGKERWHKSICDLDQMYYASVAPVIVKNHVLVGVSGDDLDIPGYYESRDPETGDLQWHWSVEPKKGEPGFETWPNADAAAHGGGMTWGATAYDPELNLIYFGTGNPQPVASGKGRIGDNLYTESIVALNADTGKLVWYFQPSPHDTHDWDNVQVPVLYDGVINGQKRKLLSMACRNGWFFVIDRTNGKVLVAKEYVKTNWARGVDAKGQPIPDPAKEPQRDGALVSPNQGGASNWPPPTFDPDTGLFYVNAARAYSVWYDYELEDKAEGWGGMDRGGWSESLLRAIDYKTGNIKWSHKWEGPGGRSGLLSTAGKLLFAGDTSGNFVALNP
ncbi:MAG: acido-empty-quinoprotein group A, partial [Acidobacteriota bacterium]|nr:acido-empty-quinoprotein group A [Acidobacteriota bacterium]